MISIIIILTASYIGDDVRIVYSLANTMRSFSVTNGRTNKGILGVGLYNLTYFVDNIIFQYLMLAALAALYLPLVVVSHVHDSMSQGKKPLDNLEKCGKLLDNEPKFFA